MRARVDFLLGCVLASAFGCADEGGGGPDVCEIVPASFVSELAEVSLGAWRRDLELGSTLVSSCVYSSPDVSRSAELTIRWDGAESFEQSREQRLDSFGGTTEDVPGLGDAAFVHRYSVDFGSGPEQVLDLVVAHGEALLTASVVDPDLSTFDAAGVAEAIAVEAMSDL